MSRPDNTTAAPGSLAPRFAMGWAALVYGVATLLLAYPALSGQFLVNAHSDQFIAGFAFRDFAAQALRAGHSIPQWNPYLFGGMPYVAAMHGDIFYPTAALRMLLPTDVAMTWGFIIHLFLSGLFTYGFLRAWGLSFGAALVGGMAYMVSGPIASYAFPGHDGKLFVSALLPLALWILVRGFRDGRMWSWGAFALVVALGVLSPHPQLLQYMLLTSGAFALFLALGSDAAGRPLERRIGMQRIGLAFAAVIIGMLIGAIQYAPVREYVAWSNRVGRDYAYATSFSFPIIELVNMYLPQFTGMLDKYWGPNFPIHWHSEYVGGSVMLLATAAFGGTSQQRFRRFWIAVAVISLLWMLGGSTPFFLIVYNLVPGTKFFRAPSTIVYVFTFALSVFAALGTERILARDVKLNLVRGWMAVGVVVAILATLGILSGLAESMAQSIGIHLAVQQGADLANAAQYATPLVERAVANKGDLLAGAWRSAIFLVLAGGVILAYLKNAIKAREFALGLTFIVGLDLITVASRYWSFLPPAKVLYASDKAIEYIKAQKEPGRVIVLAQSGEGLMRPDAYFGNNGQGSGTGLMVHGIRSINGYHGNELGRYDVLIETPLANNAPADRTPMFWRHENAQYLYTNAVIPDTSLKLLVGPIKNSAGSTVYLYRLPGENPYAWVTAGMTKAPDADIGRAVLDPRFDPARLAVFSDTNPVAVAPVTTLPDPLSIAAATTNYAPGHATITLSAPSPKNAALVVSENFYPGWSATIDGKPQPVYRADFNLIGIPLPAGAKTIELDFRDAAVGSGKVITLLALLVALGALAGGLLLDRRRLA